MPENQVSVGERPSKKPLLCLILQREGVLTDGQVEAALAAWNDMRRQGAIVPFGQTVIALGFMDAEELRPYIHLQRQLAKPPGRKPLGVLLIENAILTPSQVLLSLRLQTFTGQPLGELLVEEGLLRAPQLEVLLRFQGRNAKAS